jgi:cytochrome P450
MHEAPQDAYFDETHSAWVLSRYRDVVDALRDPCLWPVAAPAEDQSATRDEAGRLRLRAPTQEALPLERLNGWRDCLEPVAGRILDRLPSDRPVDLIAEFALPWCLELAFHVVEASPANRARFEALGNEVFAGTGAAEGSPARARAVAATAELDRLLANGPMPMGEPTFVAVSQTTARLLASIWLALYQNPAAADRLRSQPEFWSNAVDELLRFAGIVRRIWRQARADVAIGGANIAAGQRAMLMLSSANRDPEQFAEPDRLDIARRVTSQLALGAGRNSCVGGPLIRMAVVVTSRALLEKFPDARLSEEPTWRIGSGYRFPESLTIFT